MLNKYLPAGERAGQALAAFWKLFKPIEKH